MLVGLRSNMRDHGSRSTRPRDRRGGALVLRGCHAAAAHQPRSAPRSHIRSQIGGEPTTGCGQPSRYEEPRRSLSLVAVTASREYAFVSRMPESPPSISATRAWVTRELQLKLDSENLELHQLSIENVGGLDTRSIRWSAPACFTICLILTRTAPAPCPATTGAMDADGVCPLWTDRHLHDAGVCRLLGITTSDTDCETSARYSRGCQRTIRSPALCAGQWTSTILTPWPTHCFIPTIAPTPFRSSTRGSNAAACPSAAGSSRPSPSSMRDGREDPACRTSCVVSSAPARGGGIAPWNDVQTQPDRVPRRSLRGQPTDRLHR